MQTLLLADNQRPKPEPIPYSTKALRQDLDRVRNAWAKCQRRRRRDAIYTYLSAVYELVTWWAAEGRDVERARRALRSRLLRRVRAGRPVRRHHPMHSRPGQSRPTDPKQMVAGYAVRDRDQGPGRAISAVRPAQRRHQQVRLSSHAASSARQTEVVGAGGEPRTKYVFRASGGQNNLVNNSVAIDGGKHHVAITPSKHNPDKGRLIVTKTVTKNNHKTGKAKNRQRKTRQNPAVERARQVMKLDHSRDEKLYNAELAKLLDEFGIDFVCQHACQEAAHERETCPEGHCESRTSTLAITTAHAAKAYFLTSTTLSGTAQNKRQRRGGHLPVRGGPREKVSINAVHLNLVQNETFLLS